MKIKLNIKLDIVPETYAAAYGDYYDKRVTPRLIEEDALHCAEQALADWFQRIGFAGCVVDPQHVDKRGFEEWNAHQVESGATQWNARNVASPLYYCFKVFGGVQNVG